MAANNLLASLYKDLNIKKSKGLIIISIVF